MTATGVSALVSIQTVRMTICVCEVFAKALTGELTIWGGMEQRLKGKVAVITGGARGLGRGYALRLAELGADIAVIGCNLRAGDVYEFEANLKTAHSVAEECQALNVRAIELEADLTDRAKTFATMDMVAKELGTIDIAVCNAGGGTVLFADERDDGK